MGACDVAFAARPAGALPLRLGDLPSATAGLKATINITVAATQVRVGSEEAM
jgi:hypothetical protein